MDPTIHANKGTIVLDWLVISLRIHERMAISFNLFVNRTLLYEYTNIKYAILLLLYLSVCWYIDSKNV